MKTTLRMSIVALNCFFLRINVSDALSSLTSANRRTFIKQTTILGTSSLTLNTLLPNVLVRAVDGEDDPIIFVSTGQNFSYMFQPPFEFAQGKKPLKTHLDEVNFSREGVRGYQYGITVDPVRIESVKSFGTPAEVAARVVNAELVRDGVFDVTLVKDAVEDDKGYYAIEYISSGKRGVKRFLTKICIARQMLYVLTVQCKEDDFKNYQDEILASMDTFKVVDNNP
mmetsp:Transcript_18259/g.23679  ORF Transcript_18259/g.23679 Transcript_18259/m.23679 type:complete len:226 (-) Transcript_18259:39-716(-)